MGKGNKSNRSPGAVVLDMPFTDPEKLRALREKHPDLVEGMTAARWSRSNELKVCTAEKTAEMIDVDPALALLLEETEDFPAILDADGLPVSGVEGYQPYLDFLRPSRDLIRDPEETMPGSARAAEALHARLAAGEKIAVFADYDIDGIASAAVFSQAVEAAGFGEDQLIWQHASGGFGLTEDFVRRAHAEGATMLVTLDCGSAQVREIALARELGMETLIVDHHDADPTTDADHHLNPHYMNLTQKGEPHESIRHARDLLARCEDVQSALRMKPDDKALSEEYEELKTKARDTILHLDRLSGADVDSRKLQIAIERCVQSAGEGLPNHNSAGQLTWKFGQSIIEASGKEVPESWYGTPLYMAGQAALGDVMRMDSSANENRAFVRLPVDEGGSMVAPPLIRRLAEHFEEDPSDPQSMIRTRAALNLAKRTTRMDAKLIADGMRAQTDEELDKVWTPLMAEYDRCKALREDVMLPAAFEDAKKRKGRTGKPLVVSALIEGHPEDTGQARLLANALHREHGVPAAVGVVGADGVVKVSWAAMDKTKFGKRMRDNPRLRGMLEDACRITRVDQDGVEHTSSSFGGHDSVLSGSCTVENFPKFVQAAEELGKQMVRRDERQWRKTPWRGPATLWARERMVEPERIHRLEQEAAMLRPVSAFNKRLEVSTAVRAVSVEKKDPERDIFPAELELADGTTYKADLSPEAARALRTGTWFEAPVQPGKDRWWIGRVGIISAQ